MAVYTVPGRSVAARWRCLPMTGGAGLLTPLTGLTWTVPDQRPSYPRPFSSIR